MLRWAAARGITDSYTGGSERGNFSADAGERGEGNEARACLGSTLRVAHFSDGGGRGLAAVRAIERGEVVLHLPRHAMLSCADVRACPAMASLLPAFAHLSSHQLLVCYVLLQASLGAQSPWHAYLRCLPRCYTLLSRFTPQHMAMLQVGRTTWHPKPQPLSHGRLAAASLIPWTHPSLPTCLLFLSSASPCPPPPTTSSSLARPRPCVAHAQVPEAVAEAHAAVAAVRGEWREARPLLRAMGVAGKWLSWGAWSWGHCTVGGAWGFIRGRAVAVCVWRSWGRCTCSAQLVHSVSACAQRALCCCEAHAMPCVCAAQATGPPAQVLQHCVQLFTAPPPLALPLPLLRPAMCHARPHVQVSSRTLYVPWDEAGALCPVADLLNYEPLSPTAPAAHPTPPAPPPSPSPSPAQPCCAHMPGDVHGSAAHTDGSATQAHSCTAHTDASAAHADGSTAGEAVSVGASEGECMRDAAALRGCELSCSRDCTAVTPTVALGCQHATPAAPTCACSPATLHASPRPATLTSDPVMDGGDRVADGCDRMTDGGYNEEAQAYHIFARRRFEAGEQVSGWHGSARAVVLLCPSPWHCCIASRTLCCCRSAQAPPSPSFPPPSSHLVSHHPPFPPVSAHPWQVVICYGCYSNLHLLLHYGFLLPANPHDCIPMHPPCDPHQLGIPLPAPPPCSSAAHTTTPPLCLQADGTPSFLLMALLRVWTTPYRLRRRVRHVALSGSPVSEEGEVAVQRWVVGECERLLAALPTTVQQDEVLLSHLTAGGGGAAEGVHGTMEGARVGGAGCASGAGGDMDGVGSEDKEDGCGAHEGGRTEGEEEEQQKAVLAVLWRVGYKRLLQRGMAVAQRALHAASQRS
ncbi:unnamed protein product [Closterium sp. Yama58-4]|nr:unnamed protein product [Closterium sp. Yama58-4]